MNDMESRIRDTLLGREGDLPAFDLADARQVARRTRRRQIVNVAGAGVCALAVVAAVSAGFGGLLRADRVPVDQPPPVPTAVSGALAYSWDGVIYLADPDGTNAVAISDDEAIEDGCPGDGVAGGPSWSPDGRYLAFRHGSGSEFSDCGPTSVVITDPQGRVIAHFPAQGRGGVAWSPDSTRVAVWDEYSAVSDTFTIGIYRTDGTREMQVSTPPGWEPEEAREPMWMPGGTSLLVDELEVPLDGGAPRELPFPWWPPGSIPAGPMAYSPDGTQVAYGTSDALIVVRADGSGSREVFAETPYTVAWSPTGEQLAFTTSGGGPASYSNELRIVDLATGSVTRLFDAERTFIGVIGFSPQGDRILFSRDEDNGSGRLSLWSIGVDGRDARPVIPGTTESGTADAAWRPT